jgi:poly(A) polymerase
MHYASLAAEVPLPEEVGLLSRLFDEGGRELLAVGGVVREWLFHVLHGQPFAPKDTDLATDASPDEIVGILSGPKARKEGIKVFPKGESFGVISAVLKGQEYEIATYREEWYDPESGDGRRPDKVRFSNAAKDASRRDFTMNALFYDPLMKEIRDYNLNEEGEGQGFEDIKAKRVRFVGNAKERIREDRLRILRLLRFDARFNLGDIVPRLDQGTLEAVAEYRHLPGISGERIVNEFLAGLGKCLCPESYLRNYAGLSMFPAVLPGLNVAGVERVDCRNAKAILAWLLRDSEPKSVKKRLNELKWPSDVFGQVEFLLQLYRFDPRKVFQYLQRRDIWKQTDDLAKKDEMEQDICDFAGMAGSWELRHFVSYQGVARSQDFLHLKGAEIGKAIAQAEMEAYLKSKAP